MKPIRLSLITAGMLLALGGAAMAQPGPMPGPMPGASMPQAEKCANTAASTWPNAMPSTWLN